MDAELSGIVLLLSTDGRGGTGPRLPWEARAGFPGKEHPSLGEGHFHVLGDTCKRHVFSASPSVRVGPGSVPDRQYLPSPFPPRIRRAVDAARKAYPASSCSLRALESPVYRIPCILPLFPTRGQGRARRGPGGARINTEARGRAEPGMSVSTRRRSPRGHRHNRLCSGYRTGRRGNPGRRGSGGGSRVPWRGCCRWRRRQGRRQRRPRLRGHG